MRTVLMAILALACWQPGCGPDEPATGSIATALHVPRVLADDLTSIEIYVYEIDADRRPTQAELLAEEPIGTGSYNAYQRYREFKKATLAFQDSQVARIGGIPDRGPKWMFFARGLASSVLIAIGATGGPVRIQSDREEEILITLTALP